jgi:TRAP-type C4-dicarboxylate transport system permease large subunit
MDYAGVIVLISSFIILLALGVPIAFSIGISGILTMLVSIDSIPAFTTYAQRMATGLDSFALLAIPFFILAGNIMNRGGIALRLIDFARVLVGRLPGGLAFVNVLANMLFGAISGSAAASASAIGTIMGPEMENEGYDKRFSTAINVTSATTGLSIPPSNILIVYSLASGGASIAALFIAGYIPGILTGVGLMIVGAIFAIRHKYKVSYEHNLFDIGLTISNLFVTILLFYIFLKSNLHWSYLAIFALWWRTDLEFIYKKLSRHLWTNILIGGIPLIISLFTLESVPVFLVVLAVMIPVSLFFAGKPLIRILVQTLLLFIAINSDPSGYHLITSAVLLVASIQYGYLLSKKEQDVSVYFKGSKKFYDSVPSLLLLVVVIGGIIAGIFTATEASAIAVLYALFLSFVYKEVKIKTIPDILIRSVTTTAIVLLLVATSIGLSWIMSYENIPQTVSEGLLNISNNPYIILLIINLILLAVGTFMDMTPAVLIFTPIFLPIVSSQLGMNPIHFGIIMVLNLSVGLCTPPVGSVLFIGCSVSKVSIADVIKPLLPMYVAMFIVLLMVTYIPQLSLWLPGLFGFLN